MNSRLLLTSQNLDEQLIALHLELRGKFDEQCWAFESAPRLTKRDADAHATYWETLLERHKTGKNILMNAGYLFDVQFEGTGVYLSAENVIGLAKHRVSISLIHNKSPELC